MRIFGKFHTRAAKRPFRGKGSFLTIVATFVALFAPAGEAAHQPPVITAPTGGSAAQGPNVIVSGTAAGDVELVRVFEGATNLGETGPAGGYWSVTLPFADGSHVIGVRGRDAGGVWSALSATVTFSVDSVAPAVPVIVAPSDGAVVPFSTVTIEGSGEPGARVRLSLSAAPDVEAPIDNAGNWEVTRHFEDAPHTVTARVVDAAGNVGSSSSPVTFRVDTLAPAAPILDTPGNGAVVRPGQVRITGRAEPGALVSVSEGAVIGTATAASDGTWFMHRPFTEGSHTISARATDAAGHVSSASASMTFRVDTTAPPIPTITRPGAGEVVPGTFTIAGSAEPNVTVQILNNAAVLASTTATAAGTWSLEMTSFSGPKQIQARAKDAAGNLSGLSSLVTFTVDADHPSIEITTADLAVYLPTQRPRIEGRARDNNGVLAIDLHFFDALGQDVLQRNAMCASCPIGTLVDWYIERDLMPGAYTVKAWAVDQAGNRSLPAVITYVDL